MPTWKKLTSLPFVEESSKDNNVATIQQRLKRIKYEDLKLGWEDCPLAMHNSNFRYKNDASWKTNLLPNSSFRNT